jgi:flagellar hook-associated protein 3 FlgL
MRITTLLIQQRREAEVMRGQERLEEARNRVSTGVRIGKPSDSPTQIAELLRVQAQISGTQDFGVAINTSLPVAKGSESALGEITAKLREAKVLAIQANNAANGPDQRSVISNSIEAIISHIRVVANTQIDGRYIFAGTATGEEPFQIGPPTSYNGNDKQLSVPIGEGQSFGYSVAGSQIMNQRGNTDLFKNLSDIADAIRSGDTAALNAGFTELDADSVNILRLRADMGSKVNYLEYSATKLSDTLIAAQQRESDLKDADMAGAILDAKTAETTQQATLAAAAQMNSPSLLDYLR